MLLAGIIVTIAFILTALTLEQVGALQREAAAEPSSTLSSEWRFIHDRLAANLNTSYAADLKNDTFVNTTLPAIAATFRGVEAEKGYDVALRMANWSAKVNKTEWSLVNGVLATSTYDAYSVDGAHHFTQVNDTKNDGLLWNAPCLDASAPPTGCVQGVLLYAHISDGSSSMEEVMLFVVNKP